MLIYSSYSSNLTHMQLFMSYNLYVIKGENVRFVKH